MCLFLSILFSMLWTSFCWELERVLIKNGDASWYNLVRLECMTVSYLTGSCSLEWGYFGPMSRTGWFPTIAGCCSMTSLLTAYTTNSRLLICLSFEFQHSIMICFSGRDLETCWWKVLFPQLFLDLILWSSIRLYRQLKKLYTLVMPWLYSGLTNIPFLSGHETLMFLVLCLVYA